jgi:hypothetical protein
MNLSKMKSTTFLSILLATFLFVNKVIAVDFPKVKYGKVSKEELEMTVYKPDTSANAVILYDEGFSDVSYNDQKKHWMLNFKRHIRIKILDPNGVKWGNFEESLYSYRDTKETIGGIKGITYNLENGKVVKSKLSNSAVFRERENKYREKARLSMPNVKKGSVIDLKYIISSDLIRELRNWQFQYSIPVKWSRYEVHYPEYYKFNETMKGYHPLLDRNVEHGLATINITYTTGGLASSRGGLEQKHRSEIDYTEIKHSYIAKDIPAFKEEAYMSSAKNYLSKVEFELASSNFVKVGGGFKDYSTSWSDVAEEMLKHENLRPQLKGGNYSKDFIEPLTQNIKDEKVKMLSVYEFVKNSIGWNKYRGTSISQSLRKTYIDKKGNVADINLLLVAMLNSAGLNATPVLLSTRSNGLLPYTRASLTSCDYIIASVNIADNEYLLDATDPNLPAGMLPYKCLNGSGRRISDSNPEQVKLQSAKGYNRTYQLTVELNEDGYLEGKLVCKRKDRSAYGFRNRIENAGGIEEFMKKKKKNTPEIIFESHSFSNIDSIYKPTVENYDIIIEEGVDVSADFIYLSPFLISKISDNPFKLEKREYPIDYGCRTNETYQLQLKIPEGFTVEEVPENCFIRLPEKGGSYLVSIQTIGENLVLTSKFNINKTLFVQTEYETLKQFYNQIIAKQSEQIVLKKINN